MKTAAVQAPAGFKNILFATATALARCGDIRLFPENPILASARSANHAYRWSLEITPRKHGCAHTA